MMKLKPWDPSTEGDGGGGGGPSPEDVLDAILSVLNPPGAIITWVLEQLLFTHRLMSALERQKAKDVFKNSLPPAESIFLTNLSGLSGRAFVIPGSMVFPAITVALSSPATMPFALGLQAIAGSIGPAKLATGYLVNMGGKYDTSKPGGMNTLIHELTHVWQGKHGSWQWAYVFNAIAAQAGSGDPYAYTAGQKWNQYNPEQQAHIVEDWFATGMKTTSDLYRYIRDNIRPGSMNA